MLTHHLVLLFSAEAEILPTVDLSFNYTFILITIYSFKFIYLFIYIFIHLLLHVIFHSKLSYYKNLLNIY